MIGAAEATPRTVASETQCGPPQIPKYISDNRWLSQGKKKKSGKKGSGKKKKAAEDVPDPTEGMTIEELRDKVSCNVVSLK